MSREMMMWVALATCAGGKQPACSPAQPGEHLQAASQLRCSRHQRCCSAAPPAGPSAWLHCWGPAAVPAHSSTLTNQGQSPASRVRVRAALSTCTGKQRVHGCAWQLLLWEGWLLRARTSQPRSHRSGNYLHQGSVAFCWRVRNSRAPCFLAASINLGITLASS